MFTICRRSFLWTGLPVGSAFGLLLLWFWVCFPSHVPARGMDVASPEDLAFSIHTIQGAGHISTLRNQFVNGIVGIVTVRCWNGFYMQEPNPDPDDATSEGMWVYTGSEPEVQVGEAVSVDGEVIEKYPGGQASGNLSVTTLEATKITVLSQGNSLPAAIVIGIGGRLPPVTVIEDDASGDVQTSGIFDPADDGIDFYESLEGMRVAIEHPIAVGYTNPYGEIPVVGDLGEYATTMTPRGGVVVQAGDDNPERIFVDDAIFSAEPKVDVGATFSGTIIGVMDYSYGYFKVFNTQPLPPVSGMQLPETTILTRSVDQMTIATFNLHNLGPGDSQTHLNALARQIVVNLDAPDILVVQEVEDNSGDINDGTLDASQTYSRLVTAIQAVGGPAYQYRDIPPQDNADGGAEGGNIRVGFLYRTDRGVVFVDRPGGDATTPVTLVMGSNGSELSISPGRISPAHLAFRDGRKPLVGEFLFNGQKLFVIGLHLKSKSEDQPLFGRYQPPLRTTELTRTLQAQVVNDFVHSLLALDPNARVVVLGDLNDTGFSVPLSILAGMELHNLVGTLPVNERYTYVFDGNSQALDHLLVSEALFDSAEYDIVHVNAEFYSSRRASDHDPALARFTITASSLRYRVYLPWIQPGDQEPLGSELRPVDLFRKPGDECVGGFHIFPILWAFFLKRLFQQRHT